MPNVERKPLRKGFCFTQGYVRWYLSKYKQVLPGYYWVQKGTETYEYLKTIRKPDLQVEKKEIPEMGMHIQKTQYEIKPDVRELVNKGLIYTSRYVNRKDNIQKEKEKQRRSIMARFKELTFEHKTRKQVYEKLPFTVSVSSRTIYSNSLKIKTRNIKSKTFHDKQYQALMDSFLKAKVIQPAPKLYRRLRKQMKTRVVLNNDNTTRLIGYNSFINKLIKPFTFVRVPDPKNRVYGLLHKGLKYFFKVDLKNGYFNVKVNKRSRQWFTFYGVDKKLYMFRCLPIGLADSPVRFQNLVYNTIILPTQKHLQDMISGIPSFSFSNYLDDIIGAVGDEFMAKENLKRVYDQVFETAKVTTTNINYNKSFEPTTFGNILGFYMDTDLKKMFMSSNTMAKFKRCFEIFPTPYLNLFGLFNYYKEYMNVRDLCTFMIIQRVKRFFSPRYIWNVLYKLYLNLRKVGFTSSFENWKRNFEMSASLNEVINTKALYKEVSIENYAWEKGVYFTYMDVFANLARKKDSSFSSMNVMQRSSFVREMLNQTYMISLGQPKDKIEEMNKKHYTSYVFWKMNQEKVPSKYKNTIFA